MLIADRYDNPDGLLYAARAFERFEQVIGVLEDVYRVKPFNQQTPQSLTELFLMIGALQPRTIVELGAGTRSSTIALAAAARKVEGFDRLISVSLTFAPFDDLMRRHFPDIPYVPAQDIKMNLVDFRIDPAWKKPVFMLYDAHDDDIPGVKIFPHARQSWFPELTGQPVAVHDCSIVPEDFVLTPPHVKGRHFEGRTVAGYPEVKGLVEWMNEKKIPLGVPDDEMKALGFSGGNSSLIYFNCP